MRLLLDENVDAQFVPVLQEAGHDVRRVGAGYEASASDMEVLKLAVREGRVLVTNDHEFGYLIHAEGLEHSGLIFLRLERLPPAEQLRLLFEAIAFQGREPGRFTVVHPSGPR